MSVTCWVPWCPAPWWNYLIAVGTDQSEQTSSGLTMYPINPLVSGW